MPGPDWHEHHPTKQKVTSSIPTQGANLGCGPVPGWDVYKKQPIDVALKHKYSSPSFALPFPLSKHK